MKKRSSIAAGIFAMGLSGCTTTEPQQGLGDYLQQAPAGTFQAVEGEPRLREFQALMSNFDAEVIRTRLSDIYADPLYFNDTFHVIREREELRRYLLKMADSAETSVELLDYASAGDHLWVRWKMSMRFTLLWKEIDTTTVGITHLHFNPAGKIDLHRDYWDGVQGFYSELPILGSLIRWIRSRLAASE